MQENQISEIAEGQFKGLSKLNSDHDCVVSTYLPDKLLCAISTRTHCRYIQRYIHSFIKLSWAECDISLPFSGASVVTLCYIPLPSTLFHKLVFHPTSLHLAIHFFVYISALFVPYPYIIFLWSSIFFHSLYMPEPT
jgi:hypothetical protein